jgi:hypothetical protein
MAIDATAVRVGVSGIIASAVLGTAAPTSAISSLAAFTDLGYASDAGVTESNGQTVTEIRAWQNAAIVRRNVTEGTVTFKTVLIQTDLNTIAVVYGTTIAGDGSIIVTPTNERTHRAFVIDVVDGTETVRNWIPDGQITELGDVVYANGEPIGYEVTITAYPHASLNSGKGAVQKWYATLAAALTVPTIVSALPSGAGAGAIVKIVGTKFSSVVGVAGVKFNAINAAAYAVDDDGTIYATLPAGSAGSAPIIVTNSAGASTGFAYTRAT